MTTASTIKMTARQFLELGEDPIGVRLELVDGEVAVSPSPTPWHSYAILQLHIILEQFVYAHDLGRLFSDVDTIFGKHDVRRPDLMYFSKSRMHLVGDVAMEGPPDLCVEVLSPGSQRIDREDKFRQYAEAGVGHYWIVDPEQRTIEAFILNNRIYELAAKGAGDQIVHLPPFGELGITLARLWKPA